MVPDIKTRFLTHIGSVIGSLASFLITRWLGQPELGWPEGSLVPALLVPSTIAIILGITETCLFLKRVLPIRIRLYLMRRNLERHL